eukprot:CAMPEP_0113638218 /NCGR_PEP_ID=MMETSP0017_2-20120614/20011_1 /TAXON_ID=2856 /ORGANISM="Cylindrotheca closterium" /LENGTH=668 /DNA_ID=CAMNT_0000549295 /DNA_START=47 /DNA_END=2053 /DNA_ORIENTATION=- /assembly_acc=CAM_ASM_000147
MKLSAGVLLLALDVSRAFTSPSIHSKYLVSNGRVTGILHATETETDNYDDWYSDFDPSEFEGKTQGTRSSSSSSSSGGNVHHDYERDVAADNSNVDLDEVNYLLAERLSYRRTRRFEEADAIRDELLDKHGVMVRDKESTWRSGCSRSGSGQSWGRGERTRNDGRGGTRGRPNRNFGPNGHDYNLAADAGPNSSSLSDQEIHQMLAERLECKLNRDYQTADGIQDDLRNAGIAINDKRKLWRADGAMFDDSAFRKYYKSSFSEATEDTDQIQVMIDDRSKAKVKRQYQEADDIRDTLLNEYDVTINDRLAEWSVGGDFGEMERSNKNRGFEKAPGSPVTENDDEIQQMLDDRDAARKDRDFDTADSLRDELKDMGVYIDDRKRQWSMGRGSAGGNESDSYTRRGAGSLTDDQVEEITRLLTKRFACKKDRKFKSADQIRDQLRDTYNVQIDDRNKEWHIVTDGYTRSPASSPVSEETEEIIHDLVEKRAVAKLQKDYDTADDIRDMLMKEYRVFVDDRVKEWQRLDGGDSEEESESEDDDEWTAAAGVDVEEEVSDDISVIESEQMQEEELDIPESIDSSIDDFLDERVQEEEEEEEEPVVPESSIEIETEETQEEEQEEEGLNETTTSDSLEELEKLTIPLLKEKLRAMELPVGGKKAELVQRILDN